MFFLVSLIDLDCGADGSRGLNCIAVGTAIMRGGKFKDLEPKKATMGATLRVQVATHIAKSEKDCKPLLSADVSNASVAREDGDIPTTWESWLHAILRHRRWIRGLTIKAAATRLGIKIIVVWKAQDGSWALL